VICSICSNRGRQVAFELDAERNNPDRLLARAKSELSEADLGKARLTIMELMGRYSETTGARRQGDTE
jgi:hypothetical protein